MVTDARGHTGTFRGIDELATLVGAYCWAEDRVFAVAGSWAAVGQTGEPAALSAEPRVFCAVLSRRHGALAQRWAERLPARAGVESGPLVRAPSTELEDAFATLAGAPPQAGFAALVLGVLPRMRDAYEGHWGSAHAVSESPVLEVLVEAHRAASADIRGGEVLLEGQPHDVHEAARLVQNCERAFDSAAVFPAVRPS
jgi:hypothetical protein